ncbi:YfhO family protein [Fodinibius halophilus]|uniref:YfhO family protein n=1 Tax=Fodinibius halophilus TaxID=1736908 RepID=A0A6M1T6L5_9BACT|nr:YfhO family protein [Fodinibius halophilus]NGP89787.1 YfhO family protein [Fodinibius halophilus]
MSKQKQKSDPKNDFISRLSEKKQHWIALSILFLLPLILYSAIFFGGERFLGNDVLQWRAGAESVVEHIDEHDEHPLWSTNMFSGMPSYVIHTPESPYNIDSLIKDLGEKTHPIPFLWILLGGSYLFFVIQGLRPFSSALGAILIGFTTYLPIIIEAGHVSKVVAFSFIPWMFVGYYMVSRSSKKLLAFFVFALAMTLQLRARHPQVTYYFLYLLGFWWIYDSWLAYQKDKIVDWLQRTGIAFGAGILAIICSIDLYWRFYEYAQYSTRGGSTLDTAQGGGLSLEYAFSWSQGVGELLTLIIPGLYGGSSGEAYWGPKSFTSGPHYFGAIAFVLALIGLIHYRKKIKYLFFGVGSLTMLFSLGYHFPLLNEFMFNYMPYFNKFRTPEMWLIVTVFCYSVLAVFGIEALINLAKDAKKSTKDLFLPLGIAIGIGAIFALGSNALLSFEKPGEFNQYAQQLARQNNVSPDNQRVQQGVNNYINTKLKPKRKEIASSDATRYLILVLLAGGLIVGFIQRKISKGYLLLGLLLLTAYDILRVDSRYVNEKRMVSDTFDAEQMIQRRQQPVDAFIMENIESDQGYPYRVFPLMRNPFNNAIPAYFYPTIGGYTGAKLAHYQDLVDNLLMKGPSGVNHAILDMLNVKYVTAQQALPFSGYTEVFNKNNQRVYRNNDVLPKAFFVDSVKTVPSPQAAVDLMQPTANFNPETTAIVEKGTPVSATSDTTSSVTITSYKANKIELSTNTNQKDYLVLSEIYYPAGWTATIDGKPAKIHKTNFVLRGLEVPAGDHTITMTFEPASNVWGSRFAWGGHIILWLSGIGILIRYTGWGKEDSNSK